MNPRVAAAFKDRSAADAAAERLRHSGLAIRSVRVDGASDVVNSASIEVDEMATGGFFGNAAKLLDGLFDISPDEQRATDYDELVRRDAAIVTVEVDSRDAAEKVMNLLGAEGAERVSTLPQRGLDDA